MKQKTVDKKGDELNLMSQKKSPLIFSYVAEKRRDGHRYIIFPKDEPLDIEWVESVVKSVKEAKIKKLSDKMVGLVLGIPN